MTTTHQMPPMRGPYSLDPDAPDLLRRQHRRDRMLRVLEAALDGNEELLDARIDRLSPDDRRELAMHSATIVGMAVTSAAPPAGQRERDG